MTTVVDLIIGFFKLLLYGLWYSLYYSFIGLRWFFSAISVVFKSRYKSRAVEEKLRDRSWLKDEFL